MYIDILSRPLTMTYKDLLTQISLTYVCDSCINQLFNI